MPFIDIELFSLMKNHLASNCPDNPNVMVSTPIDMEREQNTNKFFGDYFEYSSDEEFPSLFTKSAPQITETDSSLSSSQSTDNEEQDLITRKRHYKSVTFAASPLKPRSNTAKEKKKVCRVLFYASKITKRPSSFLKRRKQKLAETVVPEMQKESSSSLRKLKVFFCNECGMKIYTMSNSNTHLVTEL